MNRRWGSLLVVSGLGLFPIVMQSGVSAFKAQLTAKPNLQVRVQPRAVGDVEFLDSRGNTMKLSDMKGRHVLLNIWATWCPPCREEMPSLDKLKAILDKESDIAVMALSVDQVSFEQFQAFYDALELENLGLFRCDQQAVLSALAVGGLHTTILIDHQGLEVARLLGPTTWDAPEIVDNIRSIHKN